MTTPNPHPYSDPFHSGLVQLTPTQRLMSADMMRQRSGPAMLPAGGGGAMPLDLSGVAEVVGAAQAGGSAGSAGNGNEDEQQQQMPERPMPVNDADPVNHAVVSDGTNLFHVRPIAPMLGPSLGGSTGSYATHIASPIGGPGDGAV